MCNSLDELPEFAAKTLEVIQKPISGALLALIDTLRDIDMPRVDYAGTPRPSSRLR